MALCILLCWELLSYYLVSTKQLVLLSYYVIAAQSLKWLYKAIVRVTRLANQWLVITGTTRYLIYWSIWKLNCSYMNCDNHLRYGCIVQTFFYASMIVSIHKICRKMQYPKTLFASWNQKRWSRLAVYQFINVNNQFVTWYNAQVATSNCNIIYNMICDTTHTCTTQTNTTQVYI